MVLELKYGSFENLAKSFVYLRNTKYITKYFRLSELKYKCKMYFEDVFQIHIFSNLPNSGFRLFSFHNSPHSDTFLKFVFIVKHLKLACILSIRICKMNALFFIYLFLMFVKPQDFP